MDNPLGRVIDINTAGSALLAEVEVAAISSCARCAAGKGCGAGLLIGSKSRRVQALVADGLQVRAGDHVRIELGAGELLRATALVYGVPLAGAVTLAALAYALQLGDLGAAVSAIAGLAGGILAARRRLSSTACLREFTPTVVERIERLRPAS
jgi:positive regulator of sigma E activity